ncbi:unnamed protein product, partial [Nesidiocoris tenuis]
MENCKSIRSPMEINLRLEKPSDGNLPDVPYQSLIGSLMYLATSTRPDIAFSVSYLSQFNACYRNEHWNAAKRVLRYLSGTKKLRLTFTKRAERARYVHGAIRPRRGGGATNTRAGGMPLCARYLRGAIRHWRGGGAHNTRAGGMPLNVSYVHGAAQQRQEGAEVPVVL